MPVLQVKNIDASLDSLFKSSVASTFANPKCFIEQPSNESTVEKEAIPEIREMKRKEMDEFEEQNSRKAIRLQKEKDREAKRQTPEEQEKLTRTIFVGNVPRCVSEKDHLKAFKNEFKIFGEIQSIRFRSIVRFTIIHSLGLFKTWRPQNWIFTKRISSRTRYF
jgi:RNA recognition motif-containing protein